MSRRTNRILLVVVLVAFINLPVLHSTWTRSQVERDGTDTVARVLDSRVLGDEDEPSYWLGFQFPQDIDPDRIQWTAQVDQETFEEARAERLVQVRVLEERPSAYIVEGQVRNRLGLVITVVADVILLLILLMVWRIRGRTRAVPIRIAAIGDVERCPPGGMVEQIEGDLYRVRGEVTGIDGDEIVLDAGERDVLVVLDGHHNPVGYQQPGEVRGRLVT
ncbi:MAG TPA: hypothetical protein VFY58_06660 [Nocardioides sp.]|nr:hypothetical protein [Nocardioides sp.]